MITIKFSLAERALLLKALNCPSVTSKRMAALYEKVRKASNRKPRRLSQPMNAGCGMSRPWNTILGEKHFMDAAMCASMIDNIKNSLAKVGIKIKGIRVDDESIIFDK